MTTGTTPDLDDLTQAGVSLIKTGRKTEAKIKFHEVVALAPMNEAAWLHLAALADSAAEAYTALNIVRKLNPTHPTLTKIEAWIAEQWPEQVADLEAAEFEPEMPRPEHDQDVNAKGWPWLSNIRQSGRQRLSLWQSLVAQNWGLCSALVIGIIAIGLVPFLGLDGHANALPLTASHTLAQQLKRFEVMVSVAQADNDQQAVSDHLEAMYRLAPDNSDVANAVADRYYRQGLSLRNAAQFEQAQKSFNRALTIQETMDNALLEQQQVSLYLAGVDHYQEGKWTEAIEAFEAVYQQSPSYPALAQMLYSAYFNQGIALEANLDWEAALDAFKQAQAILPGMPEAKRKVAEVAHLLNPPTPTPAPTATVTPVPTVEPSGEKRVVVDISEQQAYTYQGDTLIHQFIISTGEPGRDTVVGNYEIQNKIPVAYASTWNLDMPFWLGIYWSGPLQNGFHALPTVRHTGQRLWDGYLGQRVSYGCVILGMDDAETLYNWVDIGTSVKIQW